MNPGLEHRFAQKSPTNFLGIELVLTAVLLIMLSASTANSATSDQSSPQAPMAPPAAAVPLEGRPILLPVIPVDLAELRKRFCKGLLTDKRLRGQVLVYRSSLDPVYGKSRGCEDGGFRLENAMSPSDPTPVRSLLVRWEDFAGIDAPDPSGRTAAAVVYIIGIPLSLYTGFAVMLEVSELGGLLLAIGGGAATALLAGKMEGQRIRLVRTDIHGPLSNMLPPLNGAKP